MVLSLLALSCLPAVGLAADDMPRSHTETITGASHEYTIRMGGTMDGVNTRDPVGYGAFGQVYEPNQFVRLENVGERPVVNPWVLVNGRHRWRTMEDIVDDAVSDLPPDASEEERVRAIWEFQRHHRFHATTGDAEVKDPVKMLNVYGYTLCGDDAHVLADIWRAAGFQTRSGRPQGHCTSEAYYSGDWHLLDGDENIICLLRDNETIAEEADIVRDHDLMKRTHTYGILSGDSRNTDEFSASLTVYDGDDRGGEWNSHIGHAMDFVLRPGESIEWRWDHREKAHGIWESKNLLTGWGETAWARHGNGYWRYEPKVNRRSFLDGLESQTSIATNVTRSPKLHPKLAGTASLVIPMAMPYVIVGGRVTLTGAQAEGGRISMALSFDGEKWEPVDMGTVQADLDPHFAQGGPARYSYLLRIDMEGGREVGLDGLLIENDLQMAQLSLPGLTLGDNRIAYADESEGPRNVKLTHSWVERSTSRAPSAPNEPIFPTDAGDAEGTRIIFEWEPAEDPDGDEIADYHFQLASRADMRWVLSPNFDKLIAKTADKGQARHALPYDGLLNPDQMYYWRVRARDGQGVWGEWSEIWSFTPRSVGVPLDVALSDGTLTWRANPRGRTPAEFRVYGSDEQGFSISDTDYTVNTGNQAEKLEPTFPANFVAEVGETELVVIKPGADLPNADRAFYRVVAVDENGNRSGPSDYAEAPRPLITTVAHEAVEVGAAYEYQPHAIRSLGDLRSKSIEGKGSYNAHFWNIEKPAWSLVDAPGWLSVDPETGVVSGTPTEAGTFTAMLRVEIDGVGTDEQRLTIPVE